MVLGCRPGVSLLPDFQPKRFPKWPVRERLRFCDFVHHHKIERLLRPSFCSNSQFAQSQEECARSPSLPSTTVCTQYRYYGRERYCVHTVVEGVESYYGRERGQVWSMVHRRPVSSSLIRDVRPKLSPQRKSTSYAYVRGTPQAGALIEEVRPQALTAGARPHPKAAGTSDISAPQPFCPRRAPVDGRGEAG